jgi:cyclase
LPYIALKIGDYVEGYIKNINSILNQISDDVKIIPRQGPVASKQDLENYYRRLTATSSLVTEKMKVGKTLEETQLKGL